MRRVTDQDVTGIKAAITEGIKQPEIAGKFCVSRSLVSDIATGRVHKNVPWPNGEPPTPKRAGGQHKDIPGYDPTDKRVLELEAEVVHLTEERNRERAKVKAGAKIAGLFKAVTAEMDQRVKPFAALPAALDFRRKAEITEHIVMHLSDGHHDQVVRPEEVGGLEDYNFPISCARAERYVDSVIEWSHDTLAPKILFPSAVGLAYGDYTSGEIHKACERSYYRNQFQELPGHRPASCPDVPRPGGPLRAGPRPLSGGQPRPADAEEGLPRGQRQLGLFGRRGGTAALPRDWATSTSRFPMRGAANVNINGVGFNVSHMATMSAATWASPGTAWFAGRRA